VSLFYAKPSDKAQRQFWQIITRESATDKGPPLSCMTSDGKAAVVARMWPDNKITALNYLWSTLRMMMAQPIPRIKTGPLTKFTDWMKANKKKMAERHGSFVYVVQLGARPEAQGQGLGSKLLRRITEYADSQGLPCYLEASSPGSRRLYLRHGFVDVEEFPDLPVFSMERPAVKAAKVSP